MLFLVFSGYARPSIGALVMSFLLIGAVDMCALYVIPVVKK